MRGTGVMAVMARPVPSNAEGPTSTLDVHAIAPPLRRRLIYRAFDGLPVGAVLELISDRDPLPLLAELEASCAGAFELHTIESGPSAWRVRLRKLGRCAISDRLS